MAAEVPTMTTAASVSTTPGRPSARAVTRESAAGRPTPSTHSASRCDEKVESTAESRRSAVPPKKPALAIARGSASIPTPMFVFARLAIDEAIDAPFAALPGLGGSAGTPLDSRTSCGSSGGGGAAGGAPLGDGDGGSAGATSTRPLPRRLLRADRARLSVRWSITALIGEPLRADGPASRSSAVAGPSSSCCV